MKAHTTFPEVATRLRFRPVTESDFGEIFSRMQLTDSRTCDYTLGGIALWTDLFNYRIASSADALFISGGREDNLAIRAFALPLGGSDFSESMARMREYAAEADLWFSAVPEDRLHLFASVAGAEVSELGAEWSDYLYDIRPLANLSGNAMKKKRNHVNAFRRAYPQAGLRPLAETDIDGCMELLRQCGHDGSLTGRAEYAAVGRMLSHFDAYRPYFSAAVLADPQSGIMGFTVAETKGDTLHVHVERADRSAGGSNETLTSGFAAMMLAANPRLAYVNRQDDAGDPGLRTSKLSWHPLRLLPKFNVRVPA